MAPPAPRGHKRGVPSSRIEGRNHTKSARNTSTKMDALEATFTCPSDDDNATALSSLRELSPEVVVVSRRQEPSQLRQNSSTLLSLPAELRLEIWKYVLGNHSLHIFRRSEDVRTVVCWVCSGEPNCGHCKNEGTILGEVGRLDKNMVSNSRRYLTALLSTCRQVHKEAVKMLYEYNCFASRNFDFHHLVYALRRDYLYSIRYIRLSYRYEHYGIRGVDACFRHKLLRSVGLDLPIFLGLRRLEIVVDFIMLGDGTHLWDQPQREWLASVLESLKKLQLPQGGLTIVMSEYQHSLQSQEERINVELMTVMLNGRGLNCEVVLKE